MSIMAHHDTPLADADLEELAQELALQFDMDIDETRRSLAWAPEEPGEPGNQDDDGWNPDVNAFGMGPDDLDDDSGWFEALLKEAV
tara:strand:+ start:2952 stop:3209 length:258 start_codon:yes stop_codon:yes gene_type:complete